MHKTYLSFILSLCMVVALPSSVMADVRDSDSPYGMLTFLVWDHDWNDRHYNSHKITRAVRLMKDAGVGFVRMDFLWDDIEPVQGQYRFEKYDRIVQALVDQDIKILGLLSYNASWAAKQWNSRPNAEWFTRYAEAVSERYKDRVKYWEIWNEPDDAQYWRDQDGMRSYADLLKKVYPALKAVDPSCKVVLGGLSRNIPFSLKSIYRHGAKDNFDIVNMHPFVDPSSPQAMQTLEGIYKHLTRVMQANSDQAKPIWITEIGCPGSQGGNSWWFGRAPSEQEQAAWVERVYHEALEWQGVEKVFWAFFRDTSHYFKSGIDDFGLVRKDFSKKPAFESYRRMSHMQGELRT